MDQKYDRFTNIEIEMLLKNSPLICLNICKAVQSMRIYGKNIKILIHSNTNKLIIDTRNNINIYARRAFRPQKTHQ